jgi:hypothetical protein
MPGGGFWTVVGESGAVVVKQYQNTVLGALYVGLDAVLPHRKTGVEGEQRVLGHRKALDD